MVQVVILMFRIRRQRINNRICQCCRRTRPLTFTRLISSTQRHYIRYGRLERCGVLNEEVSADVCVFFCAKVTPTATPAAPGSSNNAALTTTQFAKAPTAYNSTGYASQYDSIGSNQGNVADYSSKGNSGSTYSSTQPPNKASGNSANVSGQNANTGNNDLSMYGKSHTSLTKVSGVGKRKRESKGGN